MGPVQAGFTVPVTNIDFIHKPRPCFKYWPMTIKPNNPPLQTLFAEGIIKCTRFHPSMSLSSLNLIH